MEETKPALQITTADTADQAKLSAFPFIYNYFFNIILLAPSPTPLVGDKYGIS
jgi:hypothetical protein